MRLILEASQFFMISNLTMEIILYSLDMPDSLSFFQKRSDSDFLFVIHYIMFTGNPPTRQDNSSINRENYESIVTLNYSLWNTHNSGFSCD